jgi:ribosomal protein S4
MKKYNVQASETVVYDVEVMANSEAEARELVLSGDVEIGEAIDSSGFQIDFVDESEGK